MATELVCVLADLHAGSTVAPFPSGFVTKEGTVLEPSRLQTWLNARYDDAIKFAFDVAGDDPMSLVVNGDAIDGNHHRTLQIVSPDAEDHVRIAEQLLGPIRNRCNKAYMTEGTECHTGNKEDSLAKMLGFEKNPESTRYSFPKLNLKVKGTNVTFFHHMPTSGRAWTEASPLAAVLANEQLEAARNCDPIPTVVCTAHAHRFRQYTDGTSLVVCSAPWQMGTRFCGKVVPSARTKPGLFLLDWRGKGHGELPQVHFRVFKAPPAAQISL